MSMITVINQEIHSPIEVSKMKHLVHYYETFSKNYKFHSADERASRILGHFQFSNAICSTRIISPCQKFVQSC
jgi:hypothetical protein